MVDYYEILGVAPDATEDEVRKGYRARANRWHPDKWAAEPETDRKAAGERFRLVQEAYGHLSDPEKRQTYDRRRSTNTILQPKPEPTKRGDDPPVISTYAAEVARELREAIENAANATTPARRRYWKSKAESWERSLEPIISMFDSSTKPQPTQGVTRSRSRRAARARRWPRSIVVIAVAIVITAVISVIAVRAKHSVQPLSDASNTRVPTSSDESP